MLKHALYLLIVSLILLGCASSPKASTPPIKLSLDASLAKECEILPSPEADDYDAWLESYLETIRMYTDCALRHKQTVAAWPK